MHDGWGKSIQIRGELPEELINIVTGRHGLVFTVLLSRQQTEVGLLIRQVLTRIIQCITLEGKNEGRRKDFTNQALQCHTLKRIQNEIRSYSKPGFVRTKTVARLHWVPQKCVPCYGIIACILIAALEWPRILQLSMALWDNMLKLIMVYIFKGLELKEGCSSLLVWCQHFFKKSNSLLQLYKGKRKIMVLWHLKMPAFTVCSLCVHK